jgi:hypothetical protein
LLRLAALFLARLPVRGAALALGELLGLSLALALADRSVARNFRPGLLLAASDASLLALAPPARPE